MNDQPTLFTADAPPAIASGIPYRPADQAGGRTHEVDDVEEAGL